MLSEKQKQKLEDHLQYHKEHSKNENLIEAYTLCIQKDAYLELNYDWELSLPKPLHEIDKRFPVWEGEWAFYNTYYSAMDLWNILEILRKL